MNAPWDAQQVEWLRAMGYTVLRPAGDVEPDGDEDADARDAAPIAVAAAPASRVPRAADDAHALRIAEEPTPPSGAIESRAAAMPPSSDAAERARRLARALPDALMRACMRAAGRREDAMPDAAFLALVDTHVLRGNPAAKRALWPALRALRRASR